MSEWTVSTLGDLCHKITDGAHHSPKEVANGLPMFSVKDMTEQGFDYSKPKKIGSDDFDKLIASGCQPSIGDILIAKDGSVMKHVFSVNTQANYVLLSSIAIVKPNSKKIDSKFLVYAIKSPEVTDTILNNFVSGSGVPRIVLKDFKKVEIRYPKLEEQKAIASVLSSLDDKIDLLHRQNTTLERMAETLFRQWFVEDAKEDWGEVPLDKLVNITSSKRIFYSEYVASGVPFYRSKEIIELHNSGSTNSELFITEARFNEVSDKFGAPQENDILLTSVGTLGVPYKVKKSDRFYFKDGNLTWFKDFTGMPSVIIYCWLKSNIGKEQLDGIKIGSTQAALTISGLKQIVFKLPPKDVIKMAQAELTTIYSKIERNQEQSQTLEKLRDNLLPKLMSGEVRVSND